MNRVIGFYGNNPLDLEHLVRESIKCGYKQPIIYTSYNNHTAYTKQFEIQMANNINHAKELLIKRFGRRADFGELDGTVIEQDPEELLTGPRNIVSSDVIITYHEPLLMFVSEAVESSLNQCYANVIIHLISDGLDTEIDPIYKKYRHHPNIRTYHNQKSGPYVAINRVFRYLETDYISILDADDIAMPNRIWRAVTALENTGKDIYGGVMEQFIDNRYSNNKTSARLERQPLVISGDKEPIIHGTQTCKRAVFEDVNGYGDYFCGADGHFIHRAVYAGYKLHISKHIVAMRRLHGASLTNNHTHGSGTNFRRDIKERTTHDYRQVKLGLDPRQFGSLDKYRHSKDIHRTN